MDFIVDSKIFEQFPGLNIGLVIAKGIDNKESSEKAISLIREQESFVIENFEKESLSQNPRIASWRQAYSSFGGKPKKNRCSVENLYRMILDGIELRSINTIVDLYNYISIKHTLPLGGDDLDKVEGNITLKYAAGDEEFTELNSTETTHPKEGEIIYMDDREVLCRRWNWRECNKSKMSTETRNAVLVVEGLPPFTKNEVEEVTQELAVLVHQYCGGETKIHILNKDSSRIEI
jgi:lysyl-tRNA synthetase class 2